FRLELVNYAKKLDPDEKLIFSFESGPEWLQLSGAGSLSAQNPKTGEHTIIVRASDIRGGTADGIIKMIVSRADAKEIEIRIPDAHVNTPYSTSIADHLAAADIYGSYQLYSRPTSLKFTGIAFVGTPSSKDVGEYV